MLKVFSSLFKKKESKPVGFARKYPPYGFHYICLKRGFPEKIWNTIHGNGGMICGGYARWCAGLSDAPLGDMDVFFPDYHKFKLTSEAIVAAGAKLIKETTFALTYKWDLAPCPIQLIRVSDHSGVVLSGTPVEIMNQFDLTVAMAHIVDRDTLLVGSQFVEDETAKVIRFNKMHGMIGGITRIAAYSKKGYDFPIANSLPLVRKLKTISLDHIDKMIEYAESFEDGEFVYIDKGM